MPLVVNVLENLDTALSEKDELVVDVEMLKEENEQLLNQYERERQMRKNQDQVFHPFNSLWQCNCLEMSGNIGILCGTIERTRRES